MRSIGEVVLRCYNRTQTSFAQPTVFCYFLSPRLGISPTFLNLVISYFLERSRHQFPFFFFKGGGGVGRGCISEEIFSRN